MLRLEREARWGPVNISVRHRDRLFTPTFLFAMGLAIGIHALGLILFQIKPYFIRDPSRLFPPVEVVVDFSEGKDSGIEASVSHDRKKSYPVLELPISKPSYPLVIPIVFVSRLDGGQEMALKKDPFSVLVEETIEEDGLFLDGSNASFQSLYPINVNISGNLSRVSILDNGWSKKNFPGLGFGKKAKSYHTTFEVKLDDRVGRIFWFKQKNSLKKNILNAYAEEIVNAMEFKKDPQGFVTDGTLEVLFYYYD